MKEACRRQAVPGTQKRGGKGIKDKRKQNKQTEDNAFKQWNTAPDRKARTGTTNAPHSGRKTMELKGDSNKIKIK